MQDQEIDEETEQEEYENDDNNDVILNIIEGSDTEDEDDFEIVVPRLKTVTRHGRIAGTWQRHFQIDSESDSDSDNDNDKDEPDNESLAHESEHEAEPEPEARITRSSTRIIKRPSRFC